MPSKCHCFVTVPCCTLCLCSFPPYIHPSQPTNCHTAFPPSPPTFHSIFTLFGIDTTTTPLSTHSAPRTRQNRAGKRQNRHMKTPGNGRSSHPRRRARPLRRLPLPPPGRQAHQPKPDFRLQTMPSSNLQNMHRNARKIASENSRRAACFWRLTVGRLSADQFPSLKIGKSSLVLIVGI